jgi:hypothetical protein
MAIRLKLNTGTEMLVQATLDELADALEAAARRGATVRIEQPDGTQIAVNPQAVETLQEDPKASAALQERFAEAAGAR